MTRLRIPTTVGNTAEALGILLAFYSLILAIDSQGTLLRFLLYLVSLGCFVFFPHDLAHFITGRSIGIRFRYYILARSSITKLNLPILSRFANLVPVFALKVDPESLRSTNSGKRAAMFASGAAASMILPFIAPVASIGREPIIISVVLFLIAAANAAFDLYYSPKAGDISRIQTSN